jgi:hypothetical protein
MERANEAPPAPSEGHWRPFWDLPETFSEKTRSQPVAFKLLRAGSDRPRRRRAAAQQPDELATFQLIELHSIPTCQDRVQDIELAGVKLGGVRVVSQPARP